MLICLVTLAIACGSIYSYSVYTEQEDDAAGDSQQQLKPVSGDDGPKTMDFTGLTAKNKEIIGWLSVDGTNIDYPVVQAPNNRYYLTHTADKKTSKQGALFTEFRNNPDFSDFNSIIYGHNLKSGKMFGKLEKFKEKKFFDKHLTGTLQVPGLSYKLEFFASAVTNPTSDYYQLAFASPKERAAHLAMIKKTATRWRDPAKNQADKLLVLSICSYEFASFRVLAGWQLSYRAG
jgi:sortase B